MKNLIIALLAITLFSCGSSEESKNNGSGSGPKVVVGTSDLASKIEFTCQSPSNDCPTSFGLVLKNSQTNSLTQSSVCSGFFISKKDLITSKACMGGFVQKCQSAVAVKDINGEIARCENITHGFVNMQDQEDLFVHIRLDRELDVTPVTFSKNVFRSNSYYGLWEVERTYQNDSYLLTKTDYCRMTKNNVRFPFQQRGNQREVILTNCPPSAESIGAAVIDPSGDVVGLVTREIENTSDFDNYMTSKKGRKLLYATPQKCLAVQRPDLFKDIEVTEENRLLCEKGIDDYNETYLRDYFLTKIFINSTSIDTQKIILDTTTGKTTFLKIRHPDCIERITQAEQVNICSFNPVLTSDYEVYKARLLSCYPIDRIKTSLISYDEYFFKLNITSNNKQVSEIFIPRCQD